MPLYLSFNKRDDACQVRYCTTQASIYAVRVAPEMLHSDKLGVK